MGKKILYISFIVMIPIIITIIGTFFLNKKKPETIIQQPSQKERVLSNIKTKKIITKEDVNNLKSKLTSSNNKTTNLIKNQEIKLEKKLKIM